MVCAAEAVRTRDYCQTEYFNASCPRDHVILVLSARYGRMRSGRCFTVSYGITGCSVDVLPFLHRRCSGHAQCEVHTMDPGLHEPEPCPLELAAFLEASYQCLRGTSERHRELLHVFDSTSKFWEYFPLYRLK